MQIVSNISSHKSKKNPQQLNKIKTIESKQQLTIVLNYRR